MKNRKKILPWMIVAVCCCAFAAYIVTTRGMGDHIPPEITVPEGTLTVSASADEKKLLGGVSAKDETDGDVTASLVVESVSDVYDDNRATVTYAAFDAAGNVSKAQRSIRYKKYIGPRLTLSGPLIFQEGKNVDIFDVIGATDKRDGRLDSQVKATLVEGGSIIEKAGEYQVEFRVTNSLGGTERLVLPVFVTTRDPDRTPHLSEYLVYLKKGADFKPMDYLTSDTRGWPMNVVTKLDTDRPGVYTVDYEDKNGAYFGWTRMIVVVEE